MRAGAPPCSRFTFRRAFRRLDIALLQTPRAASAFDYCTTHSPRLSASSSLFLSSSPSLPRAFIALDAVMRAYVRFVRCLPPLLSLGHPGFASRSPSCLLFFVLHPFFLSCLLAISLSLSFFLYFFPHFSFGLTRPDQPAHVYNRNNYIQSRFFLFFPF